MSGERDDAEVNEAIANLEDALAQARVARLPKDVPAGWEQVGWVDECGYLWSLGLRNGAVRSDRPVYAPPAEDRPTE